MRAIGDKVVLKKKERPEGEGVISVGTEVLCEVMEIGPGIPYGRGEYYSLVVQPKDLVLVPLATWDKAPSFRRRFEDRQETLRVVAEREILVVLDEGELP